MTDRRIWYDARSAPDDPDPGTVFARQEQRIKDAFRRVSARLITLSGGETSVSSTTTSGRAQYHDLTHSPLILWQFDGNALDTSGNGFNQAWTTGTARYTELVPGLLGAFFDGASGMTRAYNATIAAALIADSWTFECIGRIPWSSTLQAIFTHGTTGETEATNVLGSWSLSTGGGAEMVHEHGAGVNQEHSIEDVYNNGAVFHGALRKSANVFQFFLNGAPLGAASSALTTSSGGTSGTLNVGIGISANNLTGALASLKFVPRALTDAEIAAEYNRTLGPVYGGLT